MSLYRCEFEGEVVYAEASDILGAEALARNFFLLVSAGDIAIRGVSDKSVLRAADPEEKT